MSAERIAWWRAAGAGRIALWPLADSYRLVLAGDGDRYAELWSAAVATVGSRPGRRGRVGSSTGMAQRRGRVPPICGLGGRRHRRSPPDGRTTRLLVDPPGSGCAGYLAARRRLATGNWAASTPRIFVTAA